MALVLLVVGDVVLHARADPGRLHPLHVGDAGPGGEERVDWRVRVVREGEALVRMKALSTAESDAMEMRFPCHIHGMLKMESRSGALRPQELSGSFKFQVPEERRPGQSRLEVRYSPTLAGAMVDALPYLVDYPYACAEQIASREKIGHRWSAVGGVQSVQSALTGATWGRLADTRKWPRWPFSTGC